MYCVFNDLYVKCILTTPNTRENQQFQNKMFWYIFSNVRKSLAASLNFETHAGAIAMVYTPDRGCNNPQLTIP